MAILANWCISDNFGDKLTPYLIEKLSGDRCIYTTADVNYRKFIVCGSIMNWDVKKCVAWGPGIANKEDLIPDKEILACRGKITLNRAIACGVISNPSTVGLGDPAIVLPLIYKPNVQKKYKLGIIPHYIEMFEFALAYTKQCVNKNYKIINILDNIESVIDQINECEVIISSSLHGLIAADAYGIPTKWVKFTDKILGDDCKYSDYYSITDCPDESFLDFRPRITNKLTIFNQNDYFNLSEVIKYCTIKNYTVSDAVKLLKTCPFNKKISV